MSKNNITVTRSDDGHHTLHTQKQLVVTDVIQLHELLELAILSPIQNKDIHLPVGKYAVLATISAVPITDE